MDADGRWRGWKGSGLKARHCSEKELWGKGKLVKTRPAVPILKLFIWCCFYSHTDETGRTVTCKHCSLFACYRVWFTFGTSFSKPARQKTASRLAGYILAQQEARKDAPLARVRRSFKQPADVVVQAQLKTRLVLVRANHSVCRAVSTTCRNIKKRCVLWDKMHMSMIMAFILQRTA